MEYYTLADACRMVGASYPQTWDAVARGRIPHVRTEFNTIYVRPREVKHYWETPRRPGRPRKAVSNVKAS